MTQQKSTCPRRVADGMDRSDGPFRGAGEGLDTFEPGHGIIGQPRGCSYCGSMSQEDFLQAIRDGAEVGPSDKSYKFYLEGLKREGDPDEPRVITSANHDGGGRLRPWTDLTRAEKKAVKKARYDKDDFFSFAPWGPTVGGKFYTHHLTDQALVDEFDRLWSEGKIRWGYPGRPYVRLYLPTLPTRLQTAEGS